MKKTTWLLLIAILSTIASLSVAGASACPPSSKNPGGKPPNCGHPGQTPPPPPPAATTCSTGGLQGGPTFANSDKNEDGALSGPIHTQLEPAIDGLAPVVHEVNCDVVVSLGL